MLLRYFVKKENKSCNLCKTRTQNMFHEVNIFQLLQLVGKFQNTSPRLPQILQMNSPHNSLTDNKEKGKSLTLVKIYPQTKPRETVLRSQVKILLQKQWGGEGKKGKGLISSVTDRRKCQCVCGKPRWRHAHGSQLELGSLTGQCRHVLSTNCFLELKSLSK